MMDSMTTHRLQLASDRGQKAWILKCLLPSVLNATNDDRISTQFRCRLKSIGDCADLVCRCGPASFDALVTLARVVIDLARLDAIKEALVKLDNVAKVATYTKSHEGPIVEA